MAEHEKIVKDGVVSWPGAKEIHGEVCNLLHHGGYTGEENSHLKPPPGIRSAAVRKEVESGDLVIKVKVDADDAVKGFKRIQREARKVSQMLRELEQRFDKLQQQGLIAGPLPTFKDENTEEEYIHG